MKIAFAAVLAALASIQASSGFALQVQCAQHNQIVGLLEKKYSENRIAMGTVNDDRFMQLFVSPQGSWTILVTKTDGVACIVAAGNNWEKLPEIAEVGPAA